MFREKHSHLREKERDWCEEEEGERESKSEINVKKVNDRKREAGREMEVKMLERKKGVLKLAVQL